MVEPMTAVMLAFSTVKAVANSELGKKFIEGIIGKVAEDFTEAARAKIGRLREVIALRLNGYPRAESALAEAETGSETALREVAGFLEAEMQNDPGFKSQVESLVQDIKACNKVDTGNMVMNVSDSATGTQMKNDVVNQGGESYTGQITINKYNTPPQN